MFELIFFLGATSCAALRLAASTKHSHRAPTSVQRLEEYQKALKTCQLNAATCGSAFEIEREGKCVMAHLMPQYAIGANADETIGHFQSMMENYHGDKKTLENMLKLSKEGNDVLVEKMGRALMHTKKFTVGAIGSSVTAGHDNCQLDSYSSQLQFLLEPVFKQAGIEFESRNGGIGGACGDTFADQLYCLDFIVGGDVDVTHYSWDYFGSAGKQKAAHEDFIRASLAMPNQPMPMILTLEDKFHEHHYDLNQAYGGLGYHHMAATATNMPGVPICDDGAETKFGFIGDGRHKSSRLAENFPENSCRRIATSKLWVNWHGGPMLYQKISDALGWTYVNALKEALRQRDNGKMFAKTPQPLLIPKTIMPASQLLKASAPRCLSFSAPSFTKIEDQKITLINDDKFPASTSSANNEARDLMPDMYKKEALCLHKDSCGVARSSLGKDGRMTFNLKAKDTQPLEHGTLVICLGGGPPAASLIQKVPNTFGFKVKHSARYTHHTQLLQKLPKTAVFPSCDQGGVSSLEVDGKKYDLAMAQEWQRGTNLKGVEGEHFRDSKSKIDKCAAFDLHDKNAAQVSIGGPCGVSHIFAF